MSNVTKQIQGEASGPMGSGSRAEMAIVELADRLDKLEAKPAAETDPYVPMPKDGSTFNAHMPVRWDVGREKFVDNVGCGWEFLETHAWIKGWSR